MQSDIPKLLCTEQGEAIQLLLNLCVNARDAMPDGGTLIRSARNVVLDEHVAADGDAAEASGG